MVLCAELAPISDCTDPFRVGAELDVVLWLGAINLYHPKSGRKENREFADPALRPLLRQPPRTAARPNLAALRSTVSEVSFGESDRPHRKTTLRVIDPVSLEVDFRRLQQGRSSIPTEVGQPIATIGFLGAMALQRPHSIRVRVEEVRGLDLEPLSPTLGEWHSVKRWEKGSVDVSNLNETTVLAFLRVL